MAYCVYVQKIGDKKNVAIILGLVPLAVYTTPDLLVSVYGGYDSCRSTNGCYSLFSFLASLTVVLLPLLFSLLVSIPAYFMREEVHTYWFDRMVKIYLPIACVIVFLSTLPGRGQGGGFGPSVGGIEILIAIGLTSIGFIVLSVILIAKKYSALKQVGK